MRTLLDASMQSPTDTRWLTLEQAASITQTSQATLRREIHKGALRHARIGGRKIIRLRAEWLDQWLEGGAVLASNPGPNTPLAA